MAEGLSPEQLEIRSDIRRLYGPVRRELAGIFDPFSYDVAEGIETRIEQGIWNLPMMEAPYGDAYCLPPELFGDQDIPHIPEDDVGITALIQRYAESGIDSHAATYHSPKAQAELHERLRQIRDDNPNSQLDPARWQLYRDAARYEREELEVDRLASHSAVRARVKNTEPAPPEATGNFDTYLYFPAAELLGFQKALPELILPVGAYGKPLTEKLMTVTATIMAYCTEAGREVVNQYINEDQQEFLTQHTTRMNRKRENLSFEDTNIATVIEGVISIGQTIALLCAEKVPGYDDADQLVHDLIADGTVLAYTIQTPARITVPLIMQGGYFPDSLIKDHKGLRLSPAYRKVSTRWLGALLDENARKLSRGEQLDPPSLGLVCPVAHKNGGLPRLTETFGRVYRHVTSEISL